MRLLSHTVGTKVVLYLFCDCEELVLLVLAGWTWANPWVWFTRTQWNLVEVTLRPSVTVCLCVRERGWGSHKQTACHTVRQNWDPSSEPLSFVVARLTNTRWWKFRLKCTWLRKPLRYLKFPKLIWLIRLEPQTDEVNYRDQCLVDLSTMQLMDGCSAHEAACSEGSNPATINNCTGNSE